MGAHVGGAEESNIRVAGVLRRHRASSIKLSFESVLEMQLVPNSSCIYPRRRDPCEIEKIRLSRKLCKGSCRPQWSLGNVISRSDSIGRRTRIAKASWITRWYRCFRWRVRYHTAERLRGESR